VPHAADASRRPADARARDGEDAGAEDRVEPPDAYRVRRLAEAEFAIDAAAALLEPGTAVGLSVAPPLPVGEAFVTVGSLVFTGPRLLAILVLETRDELS
jgi:hypothetical protein